MKTEIVAATQEHVRALYGKLRQSDVEEIKASCLFSPNFALRLSYETSELCWTGVRGGVPLAMFGVVRRSLLCQTGVPWMLGSDDLDRIGNEVGRQSRYYVNEMKKRFNLLENYIDVRQKRSIRWLKWCGFKMDPAKPHGPHGMPFHRFFME